MIRLVSASRLRCFSVDRFADAHPDLRPLGEVEAGQAAVARPDHLGAPQADGDDRGAGGLGQAGGAPAALQLGLEERRATRDGALGRQRHGLAGLQGADGVLERLVRPRRAVDRGCRRPSSTGTR